MSYAPGRPGRPQDFGREPAQKGSVRAARERLAQLQKDGQANENRAPPPDVPFQIPSKYPPPAAPVLPVSPTSQYSIPIETSQPSPQWPLSHLGRGEPSYNGTSQPKIPATSNIPQNNAPGHGIPQSNAFLFPYKNQPGFPGTARLSGASDISLGSMSDFPLPTSAPRPLIPPPSSSKRGVSAYYSQFTNVSPIIEESESRTSIRSYASSNVIPSGSRNFYYDDLDSPSDDDDDEAILDGSSTLVRQASLGKRGKPSLTSIRNTEFRKSSLPPLTQDVEVDDYEKYPVSSSQESLVKKRLAVSLNNEASNSQLELEQYLGELEKDQYASNEQSTLKQVKRGTLADRVGEKVPAMLAVPATNEEANRASLTSLPDLIRRATKLAANLDRGKTASRLGTEWFTNQNGSFGTDVEKAAMGSRNNLGSAGYTSGQNTAARSADRSDGPILSPRGRKKRMNSTRCCGMSRRSFISILILLVVLVAAAIIIPLGLVVIPRKQAAGDHTASLNTECSKKLTCQNGGIATSVGGTCACLCSSSYSGYDCQNTSDGACSTISIPNLKMATVGNQVQPLFDIANKNFSIPLSSQALLMQFAKYNMSCSSENALITFPNLSPSMKALTFAEGSKPGLVPRQQTSTTTSSGTAVPTPTSTDIISSSIPVGQSIVNVDIATNSSALQFAKVGILFILQDSEAIMVASEAQNHVVQFLSSAAKNGTVNLSQTQNLTLGNGYKMNLWDGTVTLKNGTVYGNGWNGTTTSV